MKRMFKRLYFLIVLFIGKMILILFKIIPNFSGTTWPGGIANLLMKDFTGYFKYKKTTQIVMITGTGGKTTSTGMVEQLIKVTGKTVCSNAIGANMERGITTAILKASKLSGKIKADYVVLEVDERYLSTIVKYIQPNYLIVTNILKDQSQRNGEPRVIIDKIESAIMDGTHLILNGDEPNNASLGHNKDAVTYYGVKLENPKRRQEGEFEVSSPCPICSNPMKYEYDNLLYIGGYKCDKCGFTNEENTNLLMLDPVTNKMIYNDSEYTPKYITKDFLYCYSSIITLAKELGIDDESIQKSIDNFKVPSGRVEELKVADKTINYLRIKQETPVTLQSAIEIVSEDKNQKIMVFDLSEIVDFKPNYTGSYYTYDCNFNEIINDSVVKYICMSNVVCYDTATALLLNGVNKEDIVILPTDNYDELLIELEKYDCTNVYLLTWMHSYYGCVNSIEKYGK